MRTDAQASGDDAESRAATALARQGWTILARNVRVGRGELDLVAIDPGPPAELVIVEVRWRRSRAFGLAEETIDHRKRTHLRAALGRLIEDGLPGGIPLPSLPVRVDLVVVEPAGASGKAPRVRHHRAIAL
ncbi:MAG TPA: YraN family protein [Verrucomicrobiae bacterium]|jgi:putative endonuclease|nr:YraN family protein [Verrucomicrobiae bacterium]